MPDSFLALIRASLAPKDSDGPKWTTEEIKASDDVVRLAKEECIVTNFDGSSGWVFVHTWKWEVLSPNQQRLLARALLCQCQTRWGFSVDSISIHKSVGGGLVVEFKAQYLGVT
ncbi:MAG: hypothetical protein NT025_02880 [bacterium]|nr:hypothetical protein [bacterium]